MVDSLAAYLPFLIEIDRLKMVVRQSRLSGNGRRENSAEHSWHLAVFAMTLGKDRCIDLDRATRMLLIHDLVEIDAGDTPLHGISKSVSNTVAEQRAAERIFGLLPPEIGAGYRALWEEFEFADTQEAVFARAIDRLQPLLLNIVNGGGTWTASQVTEQMVAERYGIPISAAFPDLWPEIWRMVQSHFRANSSRV